MTVDGGSQVCIKPIAGGVDRLRGCGGRCSDSINIRSDKRGHIDKALPPILVRLQITADQWRINATQFEAIHRARFNRITPQLDTG